MGILDIFCRNKKLIEEIEDLKCKYRSLESKLEQKDKELEKLLLEKEILMNKNLNKDNEILSLKKKIGLFTVNYNTYKFKYKKLEEKNLTLEKEYRRIFEENRKLKENFLVK